MKSETGLVSVRALDQAEAKLASDSIGNCLITVPLGSAGTCMFYLPQAGETSTALLYGKFGRTKKCLRGKEYLLKFYCWRSA